MMNNQMLFLIETLAPYVDKLKVKNTIIYTGFVLGMYASWGLANHLLSTGYVTNPTHLDLLKVVNVVLPLAMGAIQSRTTHHMPNNRDDDVEQ
jgi:hypothetical protein